VTERPTQRTILKFWAPLAATWLMMAVEGPYLAAIIARMVDPKFNLAAHGVAYAFALLIEAPVIMLMSATTALVQDGESFRKMRNFQRALGVGTTALLLLVVVPPVHRFLTLDVVGLPREVAGLTYGALWLFLPWPAAIGYRRFYQGVLIRSGRTRLVAYGTIIRMVSMSMAALVGFLWLHIPGAWVSAMALSTGVTAEAVAARLMAARSVRELVSGPPSPDPETADLSYRDIAHFYYPLALTSLIGLTVQPMLTFFMGRSVAPVESLAVFPVVESVSFVFRSVGLAFQDTAIALMGPRHGHLPELRRFATGLGLAASAGIALVAFTPLSIVWFQWMSGLTPQLAAYALTPTRILAPLPALTVLLSLQRSVLVTARRTRPITVATATEVTFIALSFMVMGFGLGVVGVTAAFSAFVVGRVASNSFLWTRVRRVLHDPMPPSRSRVD
jgi:hypothetical protein